ncbi:MAG: DUF4446 family protein [Chlorobia bacterium]|nr:DUF4446 family protein [Fimbriimonadaceae bacterium]
MDSVFKSLAANSPQAILLLFVLSLALGIAFFLQSRKIKRLNSRWKDLMDGVKGENLERLLYDHLRERMQIQTQIDGLGERVLILEDKMTGAKRHLGLVKYDAFEDVGGSQSFALAIYDDRGDGALLTSLIGRSDCRVYSKPLMAGKSERSLSQEEQRAIQEAVQKGPKSIVSH